MPSPELDWVADYLRIVAFFVEPEGEHPMRRAAEYMEKRHGDSAPIEMDRVLAGIKWLRRHPTNLERQRSQLDQGSDLSQRRQGDPILEALAGFFAGAEEPISLSDCLSVDEVMDAARQHLDIQP